MKIKIIPIIASFYCIHGCGANKETTLKEFNNLKIEARNNYVIHKKEFEELKSCFKLKYIRVVDFKKGNFVSIEYKMNDTSQLKKIEEGMGSKEIESLLVSEGLNAAYLSDLQKKLNSINTSRIWIIDLFNRYDGTTTKGMEMKYLKEVNGLHFFYKMFEKPLDSIPKEFYSLQTMDSIGSILDKDIVLYYK